MISDTFCGWVLIIVLGGAGLAGAWRSYWAERVEPTVMPTGEEIATAILLEVRELIVTGKVPSVNFELEGCPAVEVRPVEKRWAVQIDRSLAFCDSDELWDTISRMVNNARKIPEHT